MQVLYSNKVPEKQMVGSGKNCLRSVSAAVHFRLLCDDPRAPLSVRCERGGECDATTGLGGVGVWFVRSVCLGERGGRSGGWGYGRWGGVAVRDAIEGQEGGDAGGQVQDFELRDVSEG